MATRIATLNASTLRRSVGMRKNCLQQGPVLAGGFSLSHGNLSCCGEIFSVLQQASQSRIKRNDDKGVGRLARLKRCVFRSYLNLSSYRTSYLLLQCVENHIDADLRCIQGDIAFALKRWRVFQSTTEVIRGKDHRIPVVDSQSF